MFEAGALIFRIQAVGAQIFHSEMGGIDRAAKSAGQSVGTAAKNTRDLGEQSDRSAPKVRGITREITGMSPAAQAAARDVGVALAAVGAGVIAAGALSVRAARDWETAWTGVRKTVDENADVVGGSYAEIEAGLRDLTRTLPASHEEIAAVAEAAGQLGVRAQDIVGFTRTMVDLGETTNLTADEAATSLAQFMNILQTAPEDVDRLGSAVVALGNDGASTERDIVNMAQRIAGAARVIGLTEGEALGLANALASVGIDAEAGGSAISRVMIDIAQAVSENGEDLQAWAKVAGVSAADFAKKWREDPAAALDLVVQGFGRLNDTGGDVFATLKALGQEDIRTRDAILRLAGAGDLLERSLRLGNEAWEENNALQEEAQKRYDTAAAKIDMAKNAVVDMAIELGEHLLPYVVQGAEAIADFTDFIGGLPDPVQEGIAVLGVLVGLIALAGGTALIAVPKIAQFKQSMAELTKTMTATRAAGRSIANFLTGPWGVALAVGAVAIDLLVKQIEAAKTSTETWQNALKNGVTADRLFEMTEVGGLEFLSLLDDVTSSAENFRSALDGIGETGVAMTAESQQLRDSLREIGEELALADPRDAAEGFRSLVDAYDLTADEQARLLQLMPNYRDALVEQATQLGINVSTGDKAVDTQRLLELAFDDSAEASSGAADAYLDAARETEGLERELDDLLDTLNKANQRGQDAITANIDYREAVADVDEAIRNARDGVEGYALTLADSEQAGRDNMGLLVDMAESAWEAAAAQHQLDGDTAAFQQRLQQSRDDLIQRAQDFGYTEEEARALADQILQIPTQTEWTMVADTSQARTEIGRMLLLVDELARKGNSTAANSILLNWRPQSYGQSWADGGFVEYFANGGMRENHIAQVVRGGGIRVWNEPETEGETYIPHAKSKRPRSTEILRQTANEFGYNLVSKDQAQAASDLAIMTGSRRESGAEVRISGELRIVDGKAYITGTVLEDLR